MRHHDIVQQANSRGFVFVVGEDEHPAILSGYALDFPVVHVKHKEWSGVSCEISWDLAERLATGQSNRVIF